MKDIFIRIFLYILFNTLIYIYISKFICVCQYIGLRNPLKDNSIDNTRIFL